MTGQRIDPDYAFRVTIKKAGEGSVPDKLPGMKSSCFNCGFEGHFGAECSRMKCEQVNREGPSVVEEIRKMTKQKMLGKKRGY